MKRIALMLVILLVGTGLSVQHFVSAQSISASDLIAAVNALRASRGLESYQVDSSAMAYSQEHADYMASIQTGTHTHSDGSSPWANGYAENVASGSVDFMSLDFVIYTIWADDIHMKTMVGYSSGAIGAGTAIGSDGDIYMVIDVRPGAAVSYTVPTSNAPLSGTQQAITPEPTWQPAPTDMILADGSLIHTVAYGEALWSIAIKYGVKINEILQWNAMAAGTNTIYVGQQLKIILPVTVTPATSTPAASSTEESETVPTIQATPSATQTMQSTATRKPTVTPTQVPTLTPTTQPMLLKKLTSGDKTTTTILVIVAGAIGLLLVELNSRAGRRNQSRIAAKQDEIKQDDSE